MEKDIYLIGTVVLMALVTYLPRAIPLQIPTSRWPEWIKELIEYLPVAIVAAITVPGLVMQGHNVEVVNPELISAIPCVLVALLTRNLMLSVAAGTLTYIAVGAWF